MITHLHAYRNGEFVKQVAIHHLGKQEKKKVTDSFVKEVERAAYANPHNKYWVDFKSIKIR